MTTKTTDLLNANRARAGVTRRSDLEIGDAYSIPGKSGNVYGHIGVRTDPPSGHRGKAFGRNASGKAIIGFQAILLSGSSSDDGLFVTFDGDKVVDKVGHFNVSYIAD